MANAMAQGSIAVPVGDGQAAQEKPHDFTGEIRRAAKDGDEISGFLIDRMGFRITLRGVKDPRPRHGYLIVGQVTHFPAHWRVPAIDC